MSLAVRIAVDWICFHIGLNLVFFLMVCSFSNFEVIHTQGIIISYDLFLCCWYNIQEWSGNLGGGRLQANWRRFLRMLLSLTMVPNQRAEALRGTNIINNFYTFIDLYQTEHENYCTSKWSWSINGSWMFLVLSPSSSALFSWFILCIRDIIEFVVK